MPKLADAPKAPTTTPAAEKSPRLPNTITVRGRANEDDVAVLAVDPGEHHVGVVLGYRANNAFGWEITSFAEMQPWEFIVFFKDNLPYFDWITCEKFTLYPSLAREQTGSEMPTSKLIGFIEFTIRMWNECFVPSKGGQAHGLTSVEYSSHPAAIQQGTAAVMKHKGIPHVTPKTPDHARSAELHFWHMLIRAGLVSGVQLA